MAKNITFCGICCALSIVLLTLTNILPFNTAVLLCAASAVFPIARIKCGAGYALAAAAASALLSFMFLPDKLFWAEFTATAVYAVLKGSIEGLEKLWLEILCKAGFYFAGMSIILKAFIGNVDPLLLAAGAAVFIIYDVFLTFFIGFIRKKVHF